MVAEEVFDDNRDSVEIEFECPNPLCPVTIDDLVQPATWDPNAPVDQADGHVENFVTCPACKTTYVVDAYASMQGRHYVLRDHFGVWVRDVRSTDYEEFLAEYEPSEPYDVYRKAVDAIDDLFYGSEVMGRVQQTFNRMLYLNHVSALEAYLSDRLIKAVTSDKSKLIALIGSSPKFRDNNVSLITIAKNADYPLNYVKDYLQRFSFHDFEGVAAFYAPVVKFNFFENETHKGNLLAIAQKRHHIVHRNGKDNDGKDVEVSDKELEELKEIAHRLVLRVEGAHDHQDADHFL
ncbi:hypothetical protein [Agrobacterium sp. CG674]